MSNFHIRFEIYTLCEDSVFIDTPCMLNEVEQRLLFERKLEIFR
jgi:hypothetical protein